MVAARISRQSVEVAALAGAQASGTRLDAEVAVEAQGASTGAARISRITVEVLGRRRPIASASRLNAEVAVEAQGASTGAVRISRQSVEAAIRLIRRGVATRLDAEVAVEAQAASTGAARISRQSVEVASRKPLYGPVVPLALASGIEVFLHNWVERARLVSRYETDISTSPVTGAESRLNLRTKPEREISFLWQVHGCDADSRERLDKLLQMLRKLTDERIAVPLYMDQRTLASSYSSGDSTLFFDTSEGRWHIGARVVVVQLTLSGSYASHSFHIIQDLENDRINLTAALGVNVAAGSLVIPMMDCEVVLEAKSRMIAATSAMVEMSLKEVAGASQLPPSRSGNPPDSQAFQGLPVFDFDPDWVAGVERGRIRHGQSYRQGRAERVYTSSDRSREWHKLNLNGMRGDCAPSPRQDIWRVVEFFDSRRGRTRAFWMIDMDHSWRVASLDPSGAFIGIEEFGDLPSFEEELTGQYVGLVMEDGSFYVREVTTVQQVLTVFRITVSPSLPAGLSVGNVVRVARARKTRFNRDEMEEIWSTAGYMATSLEFIETLNEVDAGT